MAGVGGYPIGAHIYYFDNTWGNTITHHGLVVDARGVIHYDDDLRDTDVRYGIHARGCAFCSGNNPGGRSVRYSCLDCFRLRTNRIRVFRYGLDRLSFPVFLGIGSSRIPDARHDAVATAFAFYRNDNFGKYELATSNCEHFVHYCVLRKLQSKQVTRALLISAPFRPFRTTVAAMGMKARRVYTKRKLNRRLEEMGQVA